MSSGDVGVFEFFSRCNEVFSFPLFEMVCEKFSRFFLLRSKLSCFNCCIKTFFFKFCLLLCLKSLLSKWFLLALLFQQFHTEVTHLFYNTLIGEEEVGSSKGSAWSWPFDFQRFSFHLVQRFLPALFLHGVYLLIIINKYDEVIFLYPHWKSEKAGAGKRGRRERKRVYSSLHPTGRGAGEFDTF